MYNAEIKERFIQFYAKTPKTKRFLISTFNKIEEYEQEWEADLCTKTEEEIHQALDDLISGMLTKTQLTTLATLREYVRWCLVMQIPGACDGMLHIQTVGIKKVKEQMIANPLQLQIFLDSMFVKESKEQLDNLYRCYSWLAFCGVKEEDVASLRTNDVDLVNMRIHYKDKELPIYLESLPAFRNVTLLDSFVYDHPNYSKPIRRDRQPGDALLRGIKGGVNVALFKDKLNKINAKAIQQGRTDVKLTYDRIQMSGLFFRMYEKEMAGIEPDFTEAAEDFMGDKIYTTNGRNVNEIKKRVLIRDYLTDYMRWKLALLS